MGAVLTVNEAATKMVRIVNNKVVIEEAQRNIYLVPPEDDYEWEITGYALPFELRSEQFGPQTKTRLEFTINGGKGNGKMFTQLFGFSIGPKSNMGKLFRRLGVDMEPDPDTREWDLDRALGFKGKSYVAHSKDTNGAVKLDDYNKPKYAEVVIDTVKALGGPKAAYHSSVTDEDLAPKASANGNGNGAAAGDGWPE